MADRKTRQPKTLIYLYGISADSPAGKVSAAGVHGLSRVESRQVAGLTCWTSSVPAAEFGDELARNMENLEWLADAGVRHQGAVGAIAARVDLLPTRFGTVFLDEDSLRRHVTSAKAAILKALKKIAGADEWGVKVFAEPQPAAVAAGVRSGKEYLQRKAALLPKQAPAGHDGDLAEFAKALAAVAEDAAPGGPVSAGQRNLVWQGSFLVPRSRQKRWQEVLNRYAGEWGGQRRIECTGPWPPYSFASTGEL